MRRAARPRRVRPRRITRAAPDQVKRRRARVRDRSGRRHSLAVAEASARISDKDRFPPRRGRVSRAADRSRRAVRVARTGTKKLTNGSRRNALVMLPPPVAVRRRPLAPSSDTIRTSLGQRRALVLEPGSSGAKADCCGQAPRRPWTGPPARAVAPNHGGKTGRARRPTPIAVGHSRVRRQGARRPRR